MDLVEPLKRPEGKALEFKRDLSSSDVALETIVAFANTSGGTLLIGVEDCSRHVRGVPDTLDLEERLASLVSDRISPRLVPDALRRARGLAMSEIAGGIDLSSPRTTRTRLARLVGDGLARDIGTGPQDPRRRYFLNERGPT